MLVLKYRESLDLIAFLWYTKHVNKLNTGTGRKRYEADLDYDSGFRNEKRLLYSNDGLIFVSYDHAQTFYEIIK